MTEHALEVSATDTSAKEAPEKERSILTLEDARLLIMSKNGLPIAASDPIMMLVTLMLAFADDYETMLERHNRAITAAMKGVVASARHSLGGEIERFAEQVRSTTLENVVLLILQHQKAMSAHQQAMRQMTWLCMAVSALLTFVVLGVLVWRTVA